MILYEGKTADVSTVSILFITSHFYEGVALPLSGYHPQTSVTEIKHRPLRIVLGWCTVDIILLNIVLLG